MAGVRFTTLQSRPREFLDFTSLMLPTKSCGIRQWLVCCHLLCERTPNLPQHQVGVLPQGTVHDKIT